MRNRFAVAFVLVIAYMLSISLASALPFTPSGNVDLQNFWNITNLNYINAFKLGGNIDAKNHTIGNLSDPTSAADAVTKSYVDTYVILLNSSIDNSSMIGFIVATNSSMKTYVDARFLTNNSDAVLNALSVLQNLAITGNVTISGDTLTVGNYFIVNASSRKVGVGTINPEENFVFTSDIDSDFDLKTYSYGNSSAFHADRAMGNRSNPRRPYIDGTTQNVLGAFVIRAYVNNTQGEFRDAAQFTTTLLANVTNSTIYAITCLKTVVNSTTTSNRICFDGDGNVQIYSLTNISDSLIVMGRNITAVLDLATTNISTLQNQVASATTNISLLQNQIASATTNITLHTNQIASATSNISLLQNQVASATANISDLYSNASGQASGIGLLNITVTQLLNWMSNGTFNISVLQGQMSSATANISSLQNFQSSATANISSIQNFQGNATYNITQLQGQMASATQNISDLQTQVSALNGSTIAQFQANATYNITQLQGQMSSATANISDLYANASGQASRIGLLNITVGQILVWLSSATTNITLHTNQIASATSNISSLQNFQSSATTNITTLKGNVSGLRGNVSALQSFQSSATTNITTNANRIGSATTNITTLQGNVSGNRGNISALQSFQASATTNITSNSNQIASATTNISSLQNNKVNNTQQGVNVTINANFTQPQGALHCFNLGCTRYIKDDGVSLVIV